MSRNSTSWDHWFEPSAAHFRSDRRCAPAKVREAEHAIRAVSTGLRWTGAGPGFRSVRVGVIGLARSLRSLPGPKAAGVTSAAAMKEIRPVLGAEGDSDRVAPAGRMFADQTPGCEWVRALSSNKGWALVATTEGSIRIRSRVLRSGSYVRDPRECVPPRADGDQRGQHHDCEREHAVQRVDLR